MKNLLIKKPEVKDFFSKDKFPLNLVDGSYPIFISLKDSGYTLRTQYLFARMMSFMQ